MLGHWQLYVLLAVSAVGLLLNQSAFQAGHVAASLPAIAVTNPVLSCIFAVTMFGEHLEAHGPLAVTVTVVSIVAMAAGTIALARSPLVLTRSETSAAGYPGSQLSDPLWMSRLRAGVARLLEVEHRVGEGVELFVPRLDRLHRHGHELREAHGDELLEPAAERVEAHRDHFAGIDTAQLRDPLANALGMSVRA